MAFSDARHRKGHSADSSLDSLFIIDDSFEYVAEQFLYYGENYLEQKDGNQNSYPWCPCGPYIVAAFTSVMFRQLALDNRLLDNRKLSARIIDEDMRGGEEWMPVVVEALDSNRRLRLRYLSQFSGQETEAEIEPQFLKRHKQRWYLIGRRGERIMTTYALDRVCSVELLDSEFEFDPAVDPATYFSDVVGVNIDSDYECERLTVRVNAPQRNYLDHLPLHPSQKCIRRTDTYSDYEFHLRAEYEFQRMLLAMAGDVEVLQPQWLRHQLFTLGNSLMTDNQ